MSASSTEVRAAVLAPSATSAERLKKQLEAAGRLASVAGVSAYEQLDDDTLLGWLSRTDPEVVLIEVEGEDGLARLEQLNRNHPRIWFLVTSAQDDPEFIIASVRAGAREFLKRPVSQAALTGALERFMAANREVAKVRGEGAIYCVVPAKEGSGATSVAINLAASISRLPGTKVALVDFSLPLGDVASYLDIRSQFRVTDALSAADRLDSVLLQTYVSEKARVSVLPGFSEFGQDEALTPSGVKSVFEVVSDTYTHAVVDLPSSLLQHNLSLLADLSKRFLFVLTAELPTIWRTYRLLEFVESRGLGKQVYLILNRVEKNHEISITEIEKTLRRHVDWMIPNDYRSSIAAIHASRPAVELNHSRLAGSYEELASGLTGISTPPSRGGLFSLFTRK